ncbi:MAG: alpha-E domain-containing protein [Thermoleophilia bacterium]|nr:alpha-E domain-containing protein [Thermoleophilia bacterium]
MAGRLPHHRRSRTLTTHDAFAVHQMAAALERAEASARVLAARARASTAGAGQAAVFAALAEAAPEGLVPAPGAGGALLARYLDQAAMAAAAAAAVLPEDVLDAVSGAAQEARRWAGGARALDPQGVARAVRREVAAVRGLAADSMSREGAYELIRLGTFLPRAAWVAALLASCASLAGTDGWRGGTPWAAAAAVTGADRPLGEGALGRVPRFLLLDARYPFSVAFALAEVEGAVFGMARPAGDTPALAMVRMAQARLHRPDTGNAVDSGMAALMDELLDAIGAVASAAVPRAGGPEGTRAAVPARVA